MEVVVAGRAYSGFRGVMLASWSSAVESVDKDEAVWVSRIKVD